MCIRDRYKYNLIDPFARGVNDISRARVAIFNDYKSLKKELGIVPKNLRKNYQANLIQENKR